MDIEILINKQNKSYKSETKIQNTSDSNEQYNRKKVSNILIIGEITHFNLVFNVLLHVSCIYNNKTLCCCALLPFQFRHVFGHPRKYCLRDFEGFSSYVT